MIEVLDVMISLLSDKNQTCVVWHSGAVQYDKGGKS